MSIISWASARACTRLNCRCRLRSRGQLGSDGESAYSENVLQPRVVPLRGEADPAPAYAEGPLVVLQADDERQNVVVLPLHLHLIGQLPHRGRSHRTLALAYVHQGGWVWSMPPASMGREKAIR